MILGYIVLAKIPAPRTEHGWIYEPIRDRRGDPAVIPYDITGAENQLAYCNQRAAQGRPIHARADTYLIGVITAYQAVKPGWPEIEPVSRVRVVDLDAVRERLPIGMTR